jgi:hypothetical protein
MPNFITFSEAPEPEVDHRTLYDRLKEQKDKKQFDYDEAHKLSVFLLLFFKFNSLLENQFRGLDDDEVGFLDLVDKLKSEQSTKRMAEEEIVLQQMRQKV